MTPEETALLVELAGMKKECPNTVYHANVQEGVESAAWTKCMQDGCENGKVFLLDDSVRVPCTGYTVTGQHGSVSYTCPVGDPRRLPEVARCVCARRGWTPCEDLATWCWALSNIGAAAFSVAILDGHAEAAITWLDGRAPSWAADAEAVLTALARR